MKNNNRIIEYVIIFIIFCFILNQMDINNCQQIILIITKFLSGLCIPLLLAISGYTLSLKINDNTGELTRKNFWIFIKKYFNLYLILSLIYFFIKLLTTNDFTMTSIMENIWQILIGNGQCFTWYLSTIVFSCILLIHIKTKQQKNILFILFTILFLIGLSFNTYNFIIINTRLNSIYTFLVEKFGNNQNFLFSGCICFLIGFYNKEIYKIKKVENNAIYIFVLGIILSIAEIIFLTKNNNFSSNILLSCPILLMSIINFYNSKAKIKEINYNLGIYALYSFPLVFGFINLLNLNISNKIIILLNIALTILIAIFYNIINKKFKKRKYELIAYLLITCFIIFIMVFGFNNIIWADEACSLAMNKFSLLDIIKLNINDVHPPLYYLLLKIFDSIFKLINIYNNKIIIGKVFSFLPLIVLLIVSNTKIKKVWGTTTALIFSLFILLMPQFLTYYIEIRMYSWSMLFVTLSYIYYNEVLNTNTVKNWILFSIFVLLAAYTHLYAALAVIIMYAILLIQILFTKNKINIKNYFIFGSATIIGYLPWIYCLLKQIKKVSGGFWISEITKDDILGYIRFIFMPDTADESSQFVLLILAIICFIYLAIYLIIKNKNRQKFNLFLGLSLPFIIIAIGVIVSIIKNPVFISRYMFPTVGCLWLSVSIIIGKNLKYNKFLWIVIFIFLLVGISNFNVALRNEHNLKKQEPEINDMLEKFDDNSIVITDSGHMQQMISYLKYPQTIYLYNSDNDPMINQLFVNVVGMISFTDIIKDINSKKNVYFINTDLNIDVEYLFNENHVSYEKISTGKFDWYTTNLYLLKGVNNGKKKYIN